MIPAMKELTALCRDRFERFGTAGHASKIRVIAMDDGETLCVGALTRQSPARKPPERRIP